MTCKTKKTCFKPNYITFTACTTGLFLLIGFVFYVINFVGVIILNNTLTWIPTFFQYYGLVAFICVAHMLTKALFILGVRNNKHSEIDE